MAVRKTGRVGGRGFGGKQAGIGSQVPGHPRHRRFADKSAPPGYVAADLAQSWLKAIVRSAAIAGASRVSIWLRCNMYTSLPSRLIECSRAMRTAGRMRPAAHPQTEFTTIMVVPDWVAARSTSAAVRSSSTPALVSSSRIGMSMSSGYIRAPLGFSVGSVIRVDARANVVDANEPLRERSGSCGRAWEIWRSGSIRRQRQPATSLPGHIYWDFVSMLIFLCRSCHADLAMLILPC